MANFDAKIGSAMWVFGYGSLMADGWETSRGCARRALAELPGHTRAFNKASIRNWGTKANPCPTLNLVPKMSSTCRGIAFDFSEDRAAAIRAYLMEREGKAFVLRPLLIYLDDGNPVEALVPIYGGKNLLPTDDQAMLVRMILCARGTDGSGIEYVRRVARELAKVGIDDPVVEEMAQHFS